MSTGGPGRQVGCVALQELQCYYCRCSLSGDARAHMQRCCRAWHHFCQLIDPPEQACVPSLYAQPVWTATNEGPLPTKKKKYLHGVGKASLGSVFLSTVRVARARESTGIHGTWSCLWLYWPSHVSGERNKDIKPRLEGGRQNAHVYWRVFYF